MNCFEGKISFGVFSEKSCMVKYFCFCIGVSKYCV